MWGRTLEARDARDDTACARVRPKGHASPHGLALDWALAAYRGAELRAEAVLGRDLDESFVRADTNLRARTRKSRLSTSK